MPTTLNILPISLRPFKKEWSSSFLWKYNIRKLQCFLFKPALISWIEIILFRSGKIFSVLWIHISSLKSIPTSGPTSYLFYIPDPMYAIKSDVFTENTDLSFSNCPRRTIFPYVPSSPNEFPHNFFTDHTKIPVCSLLRLLLKIFFYQCILHHILQNETDRWSILLRWNVCFWKSNITFIYPEFPEKDLLFFFTFSGASLVGGSTSDSCKVQWDAAHFVLNWIQVRENYWITVNILLLVLTIIYKRDKLNQRIGINHE